MKNFIRDKLENEQWSPEQIAGYCRENKIEVVSCKWIYLHIYKDKKNGGLLLQKSQNTM
jgi:IS30 family transposase